MAFKMKGSNFYGSALKQSVKKGATKKGRSQTPGPIVTDTRVSTSDGTSKKIGPAESPEAINKKAEKVFTERDKIKATAKKGDSFETYMGEGPASKAAEKKYDEAKAYVKR